MKISPTGVRAIFIYATGAAIGFTLPLLCTRLYSLPFFRNGGILGFGVYVVTCIVCAAIYVRVFKALSPWAERFVSPTPEKDR